MNNQPQKTILCDDCTKEFAITAESIKNRQSGELIFRYMVCPHCNAAFLISVTDKPFRAFLNKHPRLPLKQYNKLSGIMYNRYFDRFKELFPSAYRNPRIEGEEE